MSNRSDYPCLEALNDLKVFFRTHIKDKATLDELIDYLGECQKENRIGFRYIHERLMKYRKDFSDYFPFSEAEKGMIDDLFYFWG